MGFKRVQCTHLFYLYICLILTNKKQRIPSVVGPTNTVLADGFKERGLHGTPDDSWSLELAGTDPEFQNRGKIPPANVVQHRAHLFY